MTTTHARVDRTDRGGALVELPAVFVALTLFALCFTALGQLFIEYHHLSGAARAAARYATKSDYDPASSSASSSASARRPTASAVVSFAKSAAAPLPAAEVDVVLAPDTAAGNGVDVQVSHKASGGAYGLVTSTANALLGLVGAGPLPPITQHAHAIAIYE
jgi:Flp pilus assembly protein TadG